MMGVVRGKMRGSEGAAASEAGFYRSRIADAPRLINTSVIS